MTDDGLAQHCPNRRRIASDVRRRTEVSRSGNRWRSGPSLQPTTDQLLFNIALLAGTGLSAEALSARGREACTWAAEKAVPWLFLITHERLQPGVDAAAVLDACGLTAVMPMTGMRAQAVAAPSTIPGLQLTVPEDDQGCALNPRCQRACVWNRSRSRQRGDRGSDILEGSVSGPRRVGGKTGQQRRGPDGGRPALRRSGCHRSGAAASRVR